MGDLAAVDHQPGKRLVVRYEIVPERGQESPRIVYGKLYRSAEAERARRRLLALSALRLPGLRFPALLGYHPQRRFLVLEELAGPGLDTLLQTVGAGEACHDFGRALAALHQAGDPTEAGDEPLPHHDARTEALLLSEAATRLAAGALAADIRRAFARGHAAALAALLAAPAGRSLLLRDLHPAQVRVLPAGFGLLDTDTVALGEPELDLGNFAAHLRLAELQAGGEGCFAPDCERAFLAGYREAAPADETRLSTYTACAFLRLASLERLAQTRASRLAWPVLAQALIGEALDRMAS